MKSMRTISNRIALIVVGSLVTLLPQVGQAQMVPFHAEGEMAEYSPVTGEYTGGGRGTHIGDHMNTGQVGSIVPTGNPGEFFWVTAEPHIITAADGSTISLVGVGVVQLIPLGNDEFSAIWSAEFVVQGGTGRFANVKPGDGPIAVEAINDPFFLNDPVWTFSWTFDGTINLGRSDKK
jgi:hypothetical protein